MALFHELAFAKSFDKSDLAYCVIKVILDKRGEPVDWEFTYINDALAKIEGFEKEQLLNVHFFEVFPDGDGKWLKYYYSAAYENESVLIEDYSKEVNKVLRIRCFPVEYGYCGCILEDVTRKYDKISEEKRELIEVRALLQAASWSLEFDENEKILNASYSDEFRRIIGFENESDFPNDIFSCLSRIHPEDYDGYMRSLWRVVKDRTDKTPFDYNHRMKKKTGEYIWVRSDVKIHRNQEGKAVDLTGIFVDINENYLQEEKQRELVKEQEELQKANMAKTKFLNSISHDVRTPMNAIVGYTELAIENIDDKELLRDYLKKIQTSSNHLLSLINEVLDMSIIENDQIEINEKEENLIQIIEMVSDIEHSNLQAKNIDFRIDTTGIVSENIVCDKLRLNQILLNILSNAIKYTNPYGHISLSVTEHEDSEEHSTFVFRIKDDGIGMSKEFQTKVFQSFTRERTATENGIEGTGLGMAITKNLVDKMKGEIICNSEEGKGTEFVVTFSFRVCKNTTNEKCEEKRWTTFDGKRVLLAEDNEMNREIAQVILEHMGLAVDTAVNGREAYEKINDKTESYYDLVLMDIQMPVMDGYEATKLIRKSDKPEIAKIPIIAMTANAFSEDKEHALAVGMNGHLFKPIDRELLYETLQRFLD